MFLSFSRSLQGVNASNCFQKSRQILAANMSSASLKYETLNVTAPKEFVYHVELNRPEKMNAMNHTMWLEIGKCFEELSTNEDCRVIVLTGAGKIFTSGIDLTGAMQIAQELAEKEDVGRRAKIMNKYIIAYQKSISSLEICNKPVISAIHSACVGGGVDLITAADMRYCTQDSWYQVKEVDIGMAADVGTLQRLPKVIGNTSLARELCFTARKMQAQEALSAGLVSAVFENKESMLNEVFKIAETISKKSPIAVQGTKKSIVYSRDHSVQEGLDHICLWNQMMLQSEDFAEATIGAVSKQKDIIFSKL